MHTIKRFKALSSVALALLSISAYAVVTGAVADAGSHGHGRGHGQFHGNPPGPSVTRLNLNGYVFNAQYTLGRNTGSTFQQVYTATTVQGTPIKGPFVGAVFPPANYVALPIGHHQVYIAWMDNTGALIDVFVFNLRTHVVYDYAPTSDLKPESSGFVTVVKRGATPLP
jgi:hypothetical protein